MNVHPQRAGRWRPTLGAFPDDDQIAFRVWAPTHDRIELVLDPGGSHERRRPLFPDGHGTFAGRFPDVVPGDRYTYLVDGAGPYPDPASRWQPLGVHGPSAVVDPGRFTWTDAAWRGVPLARAVVYELHVGTFTPPGTFAGVAGQLHRLADLGVTVVELMPVADFPGTRNWGYDGASLFAPARCYGAPDDLRRLVDAAHGAGLAVLLDVVYNHFGPDGAYASVFSPFYASTRHASPWGAAVNVDGEHAGHVRGFFIENALHWLHEYHFDGLRLDATHAIVDDGPTHFLCELDVRVRESIRDRTVLLIAEDDRNLRTIVERPAAGGWGLDAVWADDFHHQARRLAAGDRDGYYQDYAGSVADLATTLRRGWFYTGQHSVYHGSPRGTDPAGIPLDRMVICLQNHDQIGNRPFGERLNHQIEPALFRALSAVLLFAPETPLVFMGQEWAASTPFLYFTDHEPALGRLVTEGRRAEFSRFDAFADEGTRARIPDPQAAATFEASRLRWAERAGPPHAGTVALYRALLRLRRDELPGGDQGRCEAAAPDGWTLVLSRDPAAGGRLWLVACLGGPGPSSVRLDEPAGIGGVRTLLTTDDPSFLEAPGVAVPPSVEPDGERGAIVRFARPAAVILKVS